MENESPNIHYSVLGAITDPQTYSNLIYLLLSFPLGLIYFLFLVIGLALGAGLSVILIGIPILLFVLGMSAIAVEFERKLANILLGTEISSPQITSPSNTSLLTRARRLIANRAYFKGIAYLLLKFPLGIVSFVVAILATALTFGLLFAPLYYQTGDFNMDIGNGSIVLIDTLARLCTSGSIA
jgi:hypothetical protein